MLWDEGFDEPVFAFTADQDWAPEWVMSRFLEQIEAHELPVHVFVTNESGALEDRGGPSLTLGAHPNFLPGSSHGSTPEEVVSRCRSLVPGATTFRSHAYAESTEIIGLMREAGFSSDSNLCLFLQPAVVPLVHASGILRFPVFLDDDSLLWWGGGSLDLDPMADVLASPGLKILNFHPTHVALNSPSVEHYRENKQTVYGSGGGEVEAFDGRGVASLLADLVQRIRSNGHHLASFAEIADDAWKQVASSTDPALYAWREDPAV